MMTSEESDRIRSKLSIMKAAIVGLASEAERNPENDDIAFGALCSLYELERELKPLIEFKKGDPAKMYVSVQ